MPSITLQNATSLVNMMSAQVQESCEELVDFTIGSPMLALVEGYMGVALLLQYIAVIILQATRLSTSVGPDVDSFLADFGLSRVQGSPASGLESFYRADSTNPAYVPVGFVVMSNNYQFDYEVSADPTNTYWDSATGTQYIIPVATSSALLPVVATQSGSASNILAGNLTQMSAIIPYVDGVTNPAGFQNGIDGETDDQAKLRFQSFLPSLATANIAAIIFAMTSVQAGLLYAIHENTASDGTSRYGTGTVIVDDGSGSPPASLITNIANAVAQIRGFGTNIIVIPPVSITSITVSLTLTVTPGLVKATIAALISAAIQTYVNSLQVEATCEYALIAIAIGQATTGIAGITNFLVNGGQSDITPAPFGGVCRIVSAPVIN